MRHRSRSSTGYRRDTAGLQGAYLIDFIGVPYRIRTGVAAVRGRCPGPLDEGDEGQRANSGCRRLDQAVLTGLGQLVPKIEILQRLLDFQVASNSNRALKVVPLFAGDAQLVTLDRYLHPELAVLDLTDQLSGKVGVDAL